MLSEKISYFIIAFAIYLLGKSLLFFAVTPLLYLIFDIAMAISLLCNNMPRVIYIHPRRHGVIRKLEYASLGVAVIALLAMFA